MRPHRATLTSKNVCLLTFLKCNKVLLWFIDSKPDRRVFKNLSTICSANILFWYVFSIIFENCKAFILLTVL
jgi:hypothetical protein